MHFKGVIVIILLVCIAFTRTDAQSFYDNADMLVKLVMNDPVFVLLDEQKKMGVADIDFSNFINETSIKREYFKYFSGKELTPILSWGLSVSLKQ